MNVVGVKHKVGFVHVQTVKAEALLTTSEAAALLTWLHVVSPTDGRDGAPFDLSIPLPRTAGRASSLEVMGYPAGDDFPTAMVLLGMRHHRLSKPRMVAIDGPDLTRFQTALKAALTAALGHQRETGLVDVDWGAAK